MTSLWEEVARQIEEFRATIRSRPVLCPAPATTVRQEIESKFDLTQSTPLDELTRAVGEVLQSRSILVTHPRYFGLFNPTVTDGGIVADTLAALYNPQLATWSHSPAANEIEHLTLRYLAGCLGYDPNTTFANFTSGGQEANMSAVLAAVAHHFPEAAEEGIYALRDPLARRAIPVIYVTSESHHTFFKIAKMAGLGMRVVSEVPVTSTFAFDTAALDAQIRADREAGRHPLMVVGTAGTTGGGIVDPLRELGAIAREHDVWFHVDAAWGGAAVMAPRLRSMLDGIERADSITWDAHKWLSVPMAAGMFFCRHEEAVRRAFAVSATYMPPSQDAAVDPYLTTMQWSRRAIGLKVFMTLAEAGANGIADRIERQARMGDRLRTKLREAGWIVVNDTLLPLVCFTHGEIRSGRVTTKAMLDTIYARGHVWISDVVLGGRERVLRACIT
ncbi:MAG TPA: pyridoxal-dependent decarboxylase, partial [Vicinamibacterales bacterium]|nr:pyridoxal-dependent decarboxylase [Vicinamibacterales bacterium]